MKTNNNNILSYQLDYACRELQKAIRNASKPVVVIDVPKRMSCTSSIERNMLASSATYSASIS
jgi:hypothetical protein